MKQVILCAIDLTKEASEAKVLQEAGRLAAHDDAQLDVMNVLPDFGMSIVGSFFSEGRTQQAQDAARAALFDFCERTLGGAVNAKVRHVVATGSIYQEILIAAGAAESSLIVVGSHVPAMSDFLLGPNAARVVRHSKCSVLVVR